MGTTVYQDAYTPSVKEASIADSHEILSDHVAHQSSQSSIPDANRWIKLPGALFSSIMSKEPNINSLYRDSKSISDVWLQSALRMDEKTTSIWRRLDISYMSAISAPQADLEALKLMNDWNGWVFAFDDPFDEGKYASDPLKATEEVVFTLSILDDVHPVVSPDENPRRHTLQSCWKRFKQRSSVNLQYRWKRYLTQYCLGVLQQVGAQSRQNRPTAGEYMEMRSRSVGVYPCIGLMEYAEGIDLPQHVSESSSLESISRITCDLVTLQNDVFSYRKDLSKGEDSNIFFILKDQGMNNQEAVDRIGEMLCDCYNRWEKSLENLPSYGDKIDHDVAKFISGCQNIALGNLHWSLYTPRYLGTDGAEVKRTGMMKIF